MDITGHWGVVTDLAPSTTSESTKTSTGNVAKLLSSGNVVKKNDEDDDEMLDDDAVTQIYFTILTRLLTKKS